MKNKILLFLLFFFVCNAVFANENKRKFEAPEGFTITIPKSWVEIPIDILYETSKLLEKIPDLKDKVFNYGFQRKYRNRWFESPYVIIQVNEDEKFSKPELKNLNDFKKEIEDEAKKAKKYLGSMLCPEVFVETALYDKKYHIFWIEAHAVTAYGTVKSMQGIILTEKGYINVICYAWYDNYRRQKKLFRKIIQSVKLDKNLAYNDKKTSSKQSGKDNSFINIVLRFIISLFKLFFN